MSFLAPGQHGPWVRPTGLPFTGLPADEAVLRDPDLWHPTRGFGVVWRATQPAMARIVQFVEALPRDERCSRIRSRCPRRTCAGRCRRATSTRIRTTAARKTER